LALHWRLFCPSGSGERTYPLHIQASKLNARTWMMILQANVTLQRAPLGIRKLAHALAIQRYFNFGSNGLNVKDIPIAERAYLLHQLAGTPTGAIP
jgi:hypothetical protein